MIYSESFNVRTFLDTVLHIVLTEQWMTNEETSEEKRVCVFVWGWIGGMITSLCMCMCVCALCENISLSQQLAQTLNTDLLIMTNIKYSSGIITKLDNNNNVYICNVK